MPIATTTTLVKEINIGAFPAAAATGITSINGLTGAAQTIDATDDTNVLLAITSAGVNHNIAASWTGQLSVARGGTGAASAAAARTSLGAAASGANTDITSLASLSTPLSIAQGGTGAIAANAALNAFLPSQATHGGKFLQTDGANTSWVAGNVGTVTSVDGTGANGISVSGGPITGAGSLTIGISDNGIALGKIAQIAANTILGNNTGGLANITALSVSDIRTLLSINNVENTALSTWAGTTNITTLGTIATGVWQGTNVALNKGGTGTSLADPNADRILFWDDSLGALTWLQLGTNLSITDTTLDAAGGSSGYATVQEEGVAITQRLILNFVGAGVTASDDGGGSRTNITLATILNAVSSLATTGLIARTGAGAVSARTIAAGSASLTVADGDGVGGNPTIDTAQDIRTTASPTFANLTLNNTGLRLLDTNASHYLTIAPGSDLTANRTLTITTGDSDRTLTFAGNATISGTNTGDQTITLTGDVTGSGAGTFAATIANSAVTLAKIQDITSDRLLGRDTAGAGATEQLTLSGGVEFTGAGGIQTSAFTGDVTKAAGGTALTIANNAVTTAKILDANVTLAKIVSASAESVLLGRGQGGGAGVFGEITLGTNLSMAGGVLNATAGSGVSIGDTVTAGTTGSILFVAAGPVLAQSNANFFWDNSNVRLGIGTAAPTAAGHFLASDAVTNTYTEVLRIGHDTSGAAAADFGIQLAMALESSTTAGQDALFLRTLWTTATHASRTSRLSIFLSQSGSMTEKLRIEGTAVGTMRLTGSAYAAGASNWPVVSNASGDLALASLGTNQIHYSNASGALETSSTLGYAVATGILTLVPSFAVTNTAPAYLTLGHNSSGAAAAGFGFTQKFTLKSSTTDDQDAGSIAVKWTTATHASRTSALYLGTVYNAGALTERLRIMSNNATQANVAIETLAAHTSIAIVPTGSGGIFSSVPDGAASGGNARGSWAIDLQIQRTLAAQVASGESSTIIGGLGNAATATYSSIVGGIDAVADKFGQQARSNGKFTNPGDAQISDHILTITTADNAFHEAFLDGTGERLTLSDDTAITFTGIAVGKRTGAVATYSSFKFEGSAIRDVGVGTTAVNGVTVTAIHETNANTDIQITADVANGSIKFEAKGDTGHNYLWVFRVETVEVTGA